MSSQKEAKNYTESIFFQQVWKGANPDERIWFDGKNFFGGENQWNETNITQNGFPPQNEPWCFEAFSRKLIENFSIGLKKMTSQKEAKNDTESIFSNKFEKVQILRKGFDLMETTFLVKPVKWDKYYQKRFSSWK